MHGGGWQSYVALSEIGDEVRPVVRAAKFLAPLSLCLIMLSILISSTSWACVEECIRAAEETEDRLLECEERCITSGRTTGSQTCKEVCSSQVGFTANRARRQEVNCKKGCENAPFFMKTSAFLGTTLMLFVAPLLGAYRGACYCECCVGKGCSARLALFNVAWTAYGFSILWALPSMAEGAGNIGGKMLFLMAQVVAVSAMAGSRHFWEKEQSKASAVQPKDRQLGVIVGAPIEGPSTLELLAQVQELQAQVRDLVRLQALKVNPSVDQMDLSR